MSGSSGRADEPHGLLRGIASAASPRARGWKAFAAPAAFLLAATIAVVVIRSIHHTASPPTPAPSHLIQTKVPVTPLRRTYRVGAGDTLSGIAAKTGVPLARIRVLNPNLQPTALFIGETIRLR